MPAASAIPRTTAVRVNEVRAPKTTRLRMSRPTSSVPNQCGRPGGWKVRSKWTLGPASWGKGAIAPGVAAQRTRTSTTAAPAADKGLRRSRRSQRARRRARVAAPGAPRGTASVAPAGSAGLVPSVLADPRVDQAIAHVHEEVGEDEREADHQRDAHHRVEVLGEDGGRAVGGDPGPGEDDLDQERVLDQGAVGHPDQRQDRGQPVAEPVAPDQAAGRQPISPVDEDERPAEDVDHAGPGDPGELGEGWQGEGEGGQGQVEEGVPQGGPVAREESVDHVEAGERARRPARPPDEWEEPEPVGEPDLEEDADPEPRQRHAGNGEEARQVVDPRVPVGGRQDPERDADDYREEEGGQDQ